MFDQFLSTKRNGEDKEYGQQYTFNWDQANMDSMIGDSNQVFKVIKPNVSNIWDIHIYKGKDTAAN